MYAARRLKLASGGLFCGLPSAFFSAGGAILNEGPPTDKSNSPAAERIESQMGSASSRCKRKCQRQVSPGSIAALAAANSGPASDPIWYVSEVTISLCICFMLKLRLMNSEASQSSNRGWEGMPPKFPKSLGVFCKPSPKCQYHRRLTATRANI